IVGKWEIAKEKAKCVIEFTKFGRINVTGDATILGTSFEDIPAIIKLGGNLQGLSYEVDEGRFSMSISPSKLELSGEKLNELPFFKQRLKDGEAGLAERGGAGRGGAGGQGAFPGGQRGGDGFAPTSPSSLNRFLFTMD